MTSRFRAGVLRYTTAENLTATVLLQRRSAKGALLRKCPSTVSAGATGAAPTFTTTGRSVSTVFTGTHTVRLADLRPRIVLKPGAYRLLVQLRRADRTPAPTVTQTFIVLAK